MTDIVALLRPYAELGPLLSGTALLLSAIEVLNAPKLARHLTEQEAKDVDAIDKFCALMMEVYFLREMGNNRRRRRLVDSMFLDHWLDEFARRPQLQAYISKHWPELYRLYRSNRILSRKLKGWRLRDRKNIPSVPIVGSSTAE